MKEETRLIIPYEIGETSVRLDFDELVETKHREMVETVWLIARFLRLYASVEDNDNNN